MFQEPLAFQSKIFSMLMELGVIRKTDSEYLAIKYYAPIFFFVQRWLLSGELTEERKKVFRRDAYKHIQSKRFIICNSFSQKVQIMASYRFPLRMGRLLSNMTSRYVEQGGDKGN